jgi:regulator of PEP synthase PpsR (kinase-PPPase family)
MDYADRIIEELGCPIVDVSHKAVEETATEIMYLRFPKPHSKELK